MSDKSMSGLNIFTEQSGPANIDTSKKLRIAIIGCGWIADVHAKTFKNQPDVEIVAGADIVPGKAEEFMKRHGIEGAKTDYASHKELIDDKSLMQIGRWPWKRMKYAEIFDFLKFRLFQILLQTAFCLFFLNS